MPGTRTTRTGTVWIASLRSALAVLLLALVLVACGSGEENAPTGGEAAPAEQAQKADALKPSEAGPASKSGEQPTSEARSAETDAGVPEARDPQAFDRRVIRSATLGIRVQDVRESAAQAQQAAAQLGGTVLRSQIDQDDGSISAHLVLSVPSDALEEALAELRDLGEEVTTDTIESEDVTEEFVDLESRERNLLAAEQSLVELYDQSESVDDTLAIQRELTQIRDQIERVQGRIEYLQQRTDFSRITLDIQSAASSRPAWDPGGVASQAWNASLRFLQALASAIISIVAFGWWLLPLIVLGIIWWRRRNKRNPTQE